MWRHGAKPRDGWADKVRSQGLIYPFTLKEDGTQMPYWNESAWYELTMDEVLHLERVTDELYAMCRHAASVMANDDRFTDETLGLAKGSLELIRESAVREDPSIYARFDLTWNGVEPKMLEINGDTPTGLVETAVIQWNWLEDVFPETDQWNSVHERLVKWWSEHRERGEFPRNQVHFLNSDSDTSGEEEMTVCYMRDTAAMAGLETFGHPIQQLGYDLNARRFVDAEDNQVRTAFKLYPWEDMMDEEFGAHVRNGSEREPVRWVEPPWKMLLSTKAILAVLWELYPGHPNLLEAHIGSPGDMLEWVAKPFHGREGSNIRIHRIANLDGEDIINPGPYDTDPNLTVYQEYQELPWFDGNRVVIGSWVIGGVAAGCLFRESDGPITDYYSRVVPHAIAMESQPDKEQQERWLNE